ncbi:hypothetical protein D9M70_497570 [compost metagenome]
MQTRLEQALFVGHLEHHEGKLAASGQHHAETQRAAPFQAADQSADYPQQWQFQDDQQGRKAQNQQRFAQQ